MGSRPSLLATVRLLPALVDVWLTQYVRTLRRIVLNILTKISSSLGWIEDVCVKTLAYLASLAWSIRFFSVPAILLAELAWYELWFWLAVTAVVLLVGIWMTPAVNSEQERVKAKHAEQQSSLRVERWLFRFAFSMVTSVLAWAMWNWYRVDDVRLSACGKVEKS
jgi:hypothetical protein